MKKLGELGISPTPWEYVAYKNEVAIVTSGGFDDLRSALCRGMKRIANARITAASPYMYDALWDLLFGDNGTANCRKCKGAEMGNCKTCRLGKARFAMEKAGGEVYCG